MTTHIMVFDHSSYQHKCMCVQMMWYLSLLEKCNFVTINIFVVELLFVVEGYVTRNVTCDVFIHGFGDNV